MMEGLPSSWLSIELSKAVIYGKGKKPKTLSKTEKKGLVPYIDIKAFEKGIIDEYADTQSSRQIDENDILVVWDGARFGLTGTGVSGAAGSTLMVLKPVLCHPKYIHSFIKRYYSYINSKPKGSGTPHVNPDIFWKLPFPIAPLNEQKRIASRLDQIIPRIDSLKARLDKIPAIMKQFRQSVLTAAVTGKLTEKWRKSNPNIDNARSLLRSNKNQINTDYRHIYELPRKWCWCALGNYAQLKRGKFSIRPRNDPRYYNGDFPFIQIGDLPRNGGLIRSHRQTLNKEGFKISKEFCVNTIAIAIVGATIGNTGILSYKMCFPDSMIGINTVNYFTSFYADYYLQTEKENIRSISYSSGGQPNIKLATLERYPFPLPPLEEQKEIVRQVDKLFALADKLEQHYQKARAYVDQLAQSVLARAFRGQLVPTEAELAEKQGYDFESAEQLLERITAEKARLEAGLKKARKTKRKSNEKN